MREEVCLIGMPVVNFGGIECVTTEQDWVVTGVHRGEHFKKYVTPNTDMDGAIRLVATILRLTPAGLEWISARRRHEVERCIPASGDWLRSRVR